MSLEGMQAMDAGRAKRKLGVRAAVRVAAAAAEFHWTAAASLVSLSQSAATAAARRPPAP